MSVARSRTLAALLLATALLLPISAQAQFGKLIDRAKAVRTKVDSAKAAIDTAKTVVTSAKAAVADATSGTTPDSSAATTGQATTGQATPGQGTTGQGTNGQAATGQTATGHGTARRTTAGQATTGLTTTAQAPTGRTATGQTTTAAGPTRARKTAPGGVALLPTPGHAELAITEPVYEQFARGDAVEKALIKANPNDRAGAVGAAVSASGLSSTDYSSVQERVSLYYAYVHSNNAAKLGSSPLSAADLTVLNSHQSDIAQLMQR